jgi:polyhydroxybutyrate depolymerase
MLLIIIALILAATVYADEIYELKINFDNTTRHALVYVPTNADASSPIPVVVNFHALASDPVAQMLMSDFNAIAERENFVVVYPRGLEGAQVWTPLPAPGPTYSLNGGGCCPAACSKGADDVGFTRFLIQEYLEDELRLTFDTSRIYATGMSNGGFMTNRVGCQMSDIFAAIAPVAGPLMENESIAWKSDPFDCEIERAVPVLHIHGLADIVVPFDGNKHLSFPKIEDSVQGWVERNGISSDEKWTTSFSNGDVTCEGVGNTANNVTLCKVKGGGHSWPGAPGSLCPEHGPFACTKDMVASEEIWAFFRSKTL